MNLIFSIPLAVFLTLALGLGVAERVSSDWDSDEGLPGWDTLAILGVVWLAVCVAVAIDLR